MSEQDALLGGSREYGATAAAPAPTAHTDFSPTELYSLSENIASSVDALSSSLRALQRMLRQVGSQNDSLPLRDNIHALQASVGARVTGTARDVARLGLVVRRGGDKAQKLQAERLTHAFRDAVNSHAAVQRQLRDKIAAHPVPPASAPRAGPLLDLTAASQRDDEQATLLANQQAQARLVEFETSMLLEREAYVSTLEATVLDVNQIMAELADIVHSQGQTIDTVESQVESAGAHVAEGGVELVKAAGYQRSYRCKLLVLLVCASIAAIVVVVVLVRVLR